MPGGARGHARIRSLLSLRLVARERAAGCPSSATCVPGTLLTDRGPGEAWQREAQLYMDRGPEPLTDQDRGLRRYELSSSLDDLQGIDNCG